MTPAFVHLHLHTEYSLVDGIVRIKPLVEAVAQAGMPAVAVTDQSNLFSMVKFYRAAQAAGVKPIVGVDLWVFNEADHNKPTRLVLLCQNRQGYLNLTRLISRSYLEGQRRGIPMVEQGWFSGASDGLIALSGGAGGDVGQALLAGRTDDGRGLVRAWRALFGDRFYLELHRTGRPGEDVYVHAAVDLALDQGVPVVATNDVRFLAREDFEAHEARVCIHDGRTLADPRRPHLYGERQYLRGADEMVELFADIPEAIENTVHIARRCNLELTLGENHLPDFPVPEGMTVTSYFSAQSRAGLEQRAAALFDARAPDFAERRKVYDERLALEIEVIVEMGFQGYFLIVADFIRWARENGIPVGPGRGSGAGSLAAYVLGITDIDPIRYDLLFERFLNPERVSLPDFDIDFCMEGRDRVIDYVAQRYGRDRVSQIITYGTMAAKAVVRDAGRVLGHPYGFVDQIAKLIPFDLGMTLDKALDQEAALRERYEAEDEVHGLIDLARSLEGITRNAGKHAGGVVIAPSPLTDFTPLYCEQGGASIVTQFDKDDVEAVGLVKFDFLGLRTLTIIDWALKTVARGRAVRGEPALDIAAIPMDDPKVYALLKDCATTAVFQLESRGMRDLIKRLQPDCFEEIIALVALFRPGPLQSGMVDDFINRKHGRERAAYPHPALEPILKPTYGVILYQEQVMQIAQVLAGYTLGGADLLRRAMGKKKPEEMAKQREVFVAGARGRGVEDRVATHIFDLMEKFAGYGFNRSHSAAYALLSYQTAYLKAHYPAAFMAAVLSSDMDNTDKVVTLIAECRDMKLDVLPPNVNTSEYRFTVNGESAILYGLGAIKGAGAAAIEALIGERNENGAFRDLYDLCRRIDLRKANRRVLEALIRAGALDGLGPNRATLMASLTGALQMAEQHLHNRQAGVDDMFGFEAHVPSEAAPRFTEAAQWSEEQRLEGEKETLGLYLTGHPIIRFEPELAQFTSARLADLKPVRDQSVVVAGLVMALQTRNSRRGDRMAFITLDDRTGRIEVAVFAEAYRRFAPLLAKDKLLVVKGAVNMDEFSGGYRISAEEVYDIDGARNAYAKRLVIDVDARRAGNGFVGALARTLDPFREGACPVWVDYRRPGARAQMPFGDEWRVRPTEVLLQRLRELAGAEHVRVEFN